MDIKLNIQLKNMIKKNLVEHSDISLDGGLQSLLQDGYVLYQDCTFLKKLLSHAKATIKEFSDKTGYECFVNKFCLTDFMNYKPENFWDLIYQGLLILKALCDGLYNFDKSRSYKIISSLDLDAEEMTLRFHALREGEEYLEDDLEQYDQPIVTINVLRDSFKKESLDNFLNRLKQ